MRGFLAAFLVLCGGCLGDDTTESVPFRPRPSGAWPLICATDSDCFASVCVASVCAGGLCEHRPYPDDLNCIAVDAATHHHFFGTCAAAVCVPPTTSPPEEGPSS